MLFVGTSIIHPSTEGVFLLCNILDLLHISEIDWKRLETVEEAGIKEGDEIEVKLIDVDPKTGKFKLSRKVLMPRPEKK